MGWIADTANAVRSFFDADAKRRGVDLARAVTPGSERLGGASGGYGTLGYNSLNSQLRIEQDLHSRYLDYEEMDDYPELASALDIYADDATQVDAERGKTVWTTSGNQQVRDTLDALWSGIGIEDDAWGLARTLAKYGNAASEVLLGEEGVIGLTWLPPATHRRVEDPSGRLIGHVQDPNGNGVTAQRYHELRKEDLRHHVNKQRNAKAQQDPAEVIVFEDWEVIHWRLRGRNMRSVYGFSVLEPVRWAWRRLTLMEDAVVLHKLTRAPARYAFYIDTGDLAPDPAMAFVTKYKNQYKKKKFVGKDGKLDFKINPLGVDEDFWFPTRNGKESSRIDLLSGADWQSVEDIGYFREKVIAGSKVPASYMGLSGEATRASLSQEDVRFARTVIRLQREIRNGLKRIGRIHLIANEIDPDSVQWEIGMTVPSSIFELAQLEVKTARLDLASRSSDFMPMSMVLTRVLGMSDDEAKAAIKGRQDQMMADGLLQASIESRAADLAGQPSTVETDAVAAAGDNESAVNAARAAAKGKLSRARAEADKEREKLAQSASEIKNEVAELRKELRALLEGRGGVMPELKRQQVTLRKLASLNHKT